MSVQTMSGPQVAESQRLASQAPYVPVAAESAASRVMVSEPSNQEIGTRPHRLTGWRRGG
jgi:hypothetical protein